jgi:hypothetical protein
MGTVTGTLLRPDTTGFAGAVRFGLVDATGRALARAFDPANDRTYIGPIDAAVSAAGIYTIALPANTSLEPAGTRWARTFLRDGVAGTTDPLIVPVGAGPFREEDILADPIDPLPEPAPANLIDSAQITAPTGNLAVNVLVITAVPNTTVTVPDVAQPVILRGGGPIRHSVANANSALMIAPPGAVLGGQLDTAFAPLGAIATLATPKPELLLDPHTPGDYQLYVFSFTTGNIVVDAGATQKAYLRAFYA